MASFPTLASGAAVLLPLTQTLHSPVRILQFGDFSTQRFRLSATLRRFQLQLDGLSYADYVSVRDFFEARKGAFDSTWDLTVSGTTYSYLAFESDELAAVENSDSQFTMTIPIRQVRKN
jgi:hypothetical protein